MRLLKFVFLLSFVLAGHALAQSVHWSPAGGQLGFNQVSEISLVFENCEPDLPNLKLPQVDGLVFNRPSQSSQTSIENFTVTRTFTLIFPVRATKRSPINIPAFEVPTDKGAKAVAAADFTVGDATVGNSGVALSDVATARLTVPKLSYWAGEVIPVTWTLNVVRRYYHSFASNVDWSPAPLIAEDWSKPEPVESLVRGERMVVSTQNTRIVAKQPGLLNVKPASQMLNLMVGSSGFGFFSQPTVEQREIDSNPLQLNVKPLPPAPAGFAGAVGDFNFTSKVIPTSGAVGEPVTWTLELSGTGNWPDVAGLPQREVSNDFQVVQPKSRRTMKDGALFEGTLTEDVVLVPTRPGTYQLAPVRFTFFDTKTGEYKTVSSDPVTLTITAPATPAQPAAGSGAPIQFSLNPPNSGTVAAHPLPTATPPVPPENLPRDPITSPARGFAPVDQQILVMACLGAALVPPLIFWLLLAAALSRKSDPQRPRREARARLATLLAEVRSAGTKTAGHPSRLRAWQTETTVLWQIPHAAPGSPLVESAIRRHASDAAPAWARLWTEADRALHSRDNALPADWLDRAEHALAAVRVPGWPPFSLFAPRHLFPFLGRADVLRGDGLQVAVRAAIWLVLLIGVAAVPAPVLGADSAVDAYKGGDFPAAAKSWKNTLANAPADWTVRHNLGLALAQQDRWAEATAYWTGAFLLDSRSEMTRWDLALGLQRSGLAPAELVEFSRGEGPYALARSATPAEWQIVLVAAALLLAAALGVLLLQGYGRIGGWGKPTALTASLVAVLLAAAATYSLHVYGPLANPAAVLVWKATTLRSIPTEADTTQKTSPLSAGSVALADRSFLDSWTKLVFPGGQTGWARTEDLIPLYR